MVYGPPDTRFRLADRPLGQPDWAAGRWTIVTAWNPHGERVDTAQNEQADQDLQRWLEARHLAARRVVNGAGEWAEPAWLLRGVTLGQAVALGRRCRQAAVLWGQGRRVALVELEPLRLRRFWLALEQLA